MWLDCGQFVTQICVGFEVATGSCGCGSLGILCIGLHGITSHCKCCVTITQEEVQIVSVLAVI